MRLTAVIAACCVASLAVAKPFVSEGPPVRKPVPAGLPDETIQEIVRGIVADKQGKLEDAVRRYTDAMRKQPLANIYYNLGDVYRRMEKIDKAIQSYQKYVELEPTAPDRKTVEALIDSLAKSEYVAALDGDTPDGVIFLDGKLLGASPQVVKLPEGQYSADRITPTGFRHNTFRAKLGTAEHHSMTTGYDTPKNPVGNVVISQSVNIGSQGSWVDKTSNIHFHSPGRQQLEPGHYSTMYQNDKRGCNPVVFDVPMGMGPDEVFYVFIDTPPKKQGDYSCMQFTIKTQRVAVPVQTK